MVEYVINENKKTIVAILNDTDGDAINYICKRIYELGTVGITDWDRYSIPKKFVGVAKCDPRDTFDIETGKIIAKKKCLDKYYKSLDKAILRYANDLYRESCKAYNALTSLVG
jgi:hypothetical protein